MKHQQIPKNQDKNTCTSKRKIINHHKTSYLTDILKVYKTKYVSYRNLEILQHISFILSP